MAAKIFRGIFGGGSKKAEPAPVKGGPIVAPLSEAVRARHRKTKQPQPTQGLPTILGGDVSRLGL